MAEKLASFCLTNGDGLEWIEFPRVSATEVQDPAIVDDDLARETALYATTGRLCVWSGFALC
jgi:hypothetical protein